VAHRFFLLVLVCGESLTIAHATLATILERIADPLGPRSAIKRRSAAAQGRRRRMGSPTCRVWAVQRCVFLEQTSRVQGHHAHGKAGLGNGVQDGLVLQAETGTEDRGFGKPATHSRQSGRPVPGCG